MTNEKNAITWIMDMWTGIKKHSCQTNVKNMWIALVKLLFPLRKFIFALKIGGSQRGGDLRRKEMTLYYVCIGSLNFYIESKASAYFMSNVYHG